MARADRKEGAEWSAWSRARPDYRKLSWETAVGIDVFPLPSRTRQPKLYRAVRLLYHFGWDSTPWAWTLTPGRPEGWSWWATYLVEVAAHRGISKRTLHAAKDLCLVDDRRHGFGPGSRVAWMPPRREFVAWVPWAQVKKYLDEEKRAGRPAIFPPLRLQTNAW